MKIHQKIYSKISGDMGGVGSHTHSGTYTSSTRSIYDALIILSLDYKHNIHILKDRWGNPCQNIDIEIAIEKTADMLTKAKFGNSMDMFQEGMKQKLIEVITDVLSDKDIIPKGDSKDDRKVRRKSGSNGVRYNSFLQRLLHICR
jgi:hypothetical protein